MPSQWSGIVGVQKNPYQDCDSPVWHRMYAVGLRKMSSGLQDEEHGVALRWDFTILAHSCRGNISRSRSRSCPGQINMKYAIFLDNVQSTLSLHTLMLCTDSK